MAKIKLSESGFTLIPEGSYVFKIVGVEYKEDFGKLEIEMQTKDGKKHTERFGLTKDNGEINEGALKAFSYFAKTALNNFSLEEIDHEDLVGCYISATIKHEEYTRTKGEKAGEKGTSVKLNDYAVAVGFGGDKVTNEDDSSDDDIDLDEFLD